MKKFVLIHSYSDLNKGDAAIIISTIQSLRAHYKGCKVDLISTFSSKDELFYADHKEISKFADNIYSSLMPQLFLNISGKSNYSTLSKFCAMLYMTPKYILSALAQKLFGITLFLNKDEIESIEVIKNADLIISKGGSFLSSRGSFRDDFSLMRMLYPFFIAKIYNKKTVILSQSVGPFKGKRSQLIFNKALYFIDDIYFREYDCIELLKKDNILISDSKVKFCPDMAFSLIVDSEIDVVSLMQFNENCKYIGMTVVNFPFETEAEKEQYINSLVFACEKLSLTHKIVIFPQVITHNYDVDYKPDLELAYEVSARASCGVTVINKNLSSFELSYLYSKCDIFIASRLHSSIFALTQGVPCINISYHGTKAEGTFGLYDLNEYVIRNTNVTPHSLHSLIEKVISNKDSLKIKIADNNKIINKEIMSVVSGLLSDDHFV